MKIAIEWITRHTEGLVYSTLALYLVTDIIVTSIKNKQNGKG
jgi:hypothetical protein